MNAFSGTKKKTPRFLDDYLEPPRPRKRRPRSKPFPAITLAAALKRVVSSPSIRKRLEVADIVAAWDEVVGETVAQHVQPTELDKGTLFLEADSSVWRQQIRFMRADLQKKIVEKFGPEKVQKIQIK